MWHAWAYGSVYARRRAAWHPSLRRKYLFALIAYCVVCALMHSRLAEEDVAVAGAYGVDMTQIAVAATAVSRLRTVMVEVSSDGYVIGVRLLSEEAREWDSQTFEDRVKLVASVAHDRYLAGLGATDDSYPTVESVAAAERELDF
jgi:hypothetical protein